MLRRVALVRTDVWEERIAYIISVNKFGELVTLNVLTCSLIAVTLMMEAIRYYETSVLTRAKQRSIPEDGIIYSHCRETSNHT
jgi:hypothetical protein